MTDAVSAAYRMARQGYGWEDIQAKHPQLSKQRIWKIVCFVADQKQELRKHR